MAGFYFEMRFWYAPLATQKFEERVVGLAVGWCGRNFYFERAVGKFSDDFITRSAWGDFNF